MWTLLRYLVRGRRLRHVGTVAGLAVGTLVLALAVAVVIRGGANLRHQIRTLFPVQRVVLRPASIDALWFRFETAAVTPETLERIAAHPGVVRVSPEMSIRFPISGEAELAGQHLRTDITVTAVEPWVLGEGAPADFAYTPGRPVPSVLSEYFLDLYNMALAESNRLPKFSPQAVIGRNFELILGESTLHAGQSSAMRVPSRISALTPNPDLLGLVLPLEAVRTFNQAFGHHDERYRALHVELDSAEALEALREHLPRFGLVIHDRLATWRRALLLVRIVALAGMALALAVFALALANLMGAVRAMLLQRRREFALLGALGASPRAIHAMVMAEVGAVSAIGILLGLGVAVGICAWADRLYAAWRAGRTFLPEQMVDLGWPWILGLGGFCWFLAMSLAALRVRQAIRGPISRPLGLGE